MEAQVVRIRKVHDRLLKADLAESTEAAFARLAIKSLAVIYIRMRMQANNQLNSLPIEPQCAADRSYIRAAADLCDGLKNSINAYHDSTDPHKKRVYQLCNQFHE